MNEIQCAFVIFCSFAFNLRRRYLMIFYCTQHTPAANADNQQWQPAIVFRCPAWEDAVPAGKLERFLLTAMHTCWRRHMCALGCLVLRIVHLEHLRFRRARRRFLFGSATFATFAVCCMVLQRVLQMSS